MYKAIRLILVFLFISLFPFCEVSAIGYGEEILIFQNKISGEYKKTYRMLYRFDYDIFRDELVSYIKKNSIPNSQLFQDWSIIYSRYCNRNDCTINGNINSTTDFNSFSTIIYSDFTWIELIKIYHEIGFTILVRIIILILIYTLYKFLISKYKIYKLSH